MKRNTITEFRQKPPKPLVIGQAVEVTRGQLSGLTGVVVRLGRHGNCHIVIDSVQKGILLNISLTSVRPLRADWKAAGPGEPPLEWRAN